MQIHKPGLKVLDFTFSIHNPNEAMDGEKVTLAKRYDLDIENLNRSVLMHWKYNLYINIHYAQYCRLRL